MIRTVGLMFLLTAALQAGGISGIWTAQITGKFGEVQDVAFRFAQNGAAVSGKMYGDSESLPIIEGKIEGDRITFRISTEMNGGQSKFIYTGAVKENEIQLVRERELPPGTEETPERRRKQTITLKRLL